MMKKKNKQEKPVNINMSFDEAMKRLSKVEKEKVDTNIKRHNSKKK